MAAVMTRPKTLSWLPKVEADLKQLENRMLTVSQMGHDTLDAAVGMIIRAGGKRLRPTITILAGRAMGIPTDPLITVAASVELLHTATLVHDDLIDGALERRGAPTLHSQLSAGVTVLTGDFLFAQSADLAAQAESIPVVQLFSKTLVRICQGEILQAQTRWHVPSEAVYIERIYGKTAALYEAAAEAAALLGGVGEAERRAYAEYGRKLGLAFQIVDDALDFTSTSEKLGKPAGNDMRQGIFNLPVMAYVEQGYISEAALSARLEAEDDLDGLVSAIREAGMVEASMERAQSYVDGAIAELDLLPHNPYTDALRDLASYVTDRDY